MPSTAPAGEPDQEWLRAVAALTPRLIGDLASDEYDWPDYADRLVAMCADADAATRAALKTGRIEAMQLLRRNAGDHYKRVMDALAGRG